MATEPSGTQAIDRAAQLLVRVVESTEPPSIGELEVGLSALAAPVLGANGVAIAALSISGPTSRLKQRIDELAPLLKSEAQTLSLLMRGAA